MPPRWSPKTPEATAELEAAGRAAETTNRVVGAYLVAIRPGENGPVPVRRREQIRTLGPPPTIRTDLGPQAESRPGPIPRRLTEAQHVPLRRV